MLTLTPSLAKAVEIATAFVGRELALQRRLNPQVNPDEVWAGIAFDGRMVIGHPVLQPGQGLYVNQLGQWTEA
jgi:hypothetical protein